MSKNRQKFEASILAALEARNLESRGTFPTFTLCLQLHELRKVVFEPVLDFIL